MRGFPQFFFLVVDVVKMRHDTKRRLWITSHSSHSSLCFVVYLLTSSTSHHAFTDRFSAVSVVLVSVPAVCTSVVSMCAAPNKTLCLLSTIPMCAFLCVDSNIVIVVPIGFLSLILNTRCRNVNAWHWEEKGVSERARNELRSRITTKTLLDNDTCRVRFTSAEISGEASLTKRKQRNFVVFDFEVTLSWEAEDRTSPGSLLTKGTVFFTFDCSDYENPEFEVKFGEGTNRVDYLYQVVKEQGRAFLRSAIREYVTMLKSEADGGSRCVLYCELVSVY